MKLRFTLPPKPGRCRRPHQNLPSNENSRLSPELQCTCSDEVETVEIQNSHNGSWRDQDRERIFVLPRLDAFLRWPLPSAITRWYACTSITWKTLRKTRIFLWVGQRWATVVDETRREHFMQNEKIRACGCSWIVVQFWYEFILHIIVIAGLAKYIIKYTSKSSKRSDELAPRNCSRDPPKTQNKKSKEFYNRASDDRLRDLPEWLKEFTENLEDTEVPATAHISHDSDSESLQQWHSGSTVFTLTSQKNRNIAMYACEPRWQGLLAEDSRKVWWLDNNRSRRPQWRMWISNQSPIRSRGTRSAK